MNKKKENKKETTSQTTVLPPVTLFKTKQEFAEEEAKLKRLASMLTPETWDTVLSLDEDLNATKKLHVFWQMMKGFVCTISTQDPSRIHQLTARLALKKNNHEESIQAVDQLARELTSCCNTLNLRLAHPQKFEELLSIYKKNTPAEKWKKDGLSPTIELVTHPDWLEPLFEKDGLFLGDYILLEVIEKIGEVGKKAASELKPDLRENLKKFKQKKETNLLKHWINTKDSSKSISQVLDVLAEIILEDKVKKSINFGEKNVVALTKNVQEPIEAILSPKNKVEKEGQSIKLLRKESLLGEIQIPTISKDLSDSIFKGATKLNTVNGHRLIRLLPRMAFNQKTNGNPDYRVLHFERGATEIAEKIGLKNKRYVTEVKNIVHAMAYFQFTAQQISGNLIQLSKQLSTRTHRQESYLITVGPPLLPYHTFKTPKTNGAGLLIPILEDPPVVSPTQTHAAQYLLQMKIMGEFSSQSRYLASYDAIVITSERWQVLAQACGIKKEILSRILDRWTQDGTDKPKLLEKIETNHYTLGSSHQKALNFLKEQGRIRTEQSKSGKKSAKKRKSQKPLK